MQSFNRLAWNTMLISMYLLVALGHLLIGALCGFIAFGVIIGIGQLYFGLPLDFPDWLRWTEIAIVACSGCTYLALHRAELRLVDLRQALNNRLSG